MSKSITLNESDCKCYTCQRCAQDCSHNNNFFRDVLSTFKMDDPDNYINTIDLNIDDVEVMDSYVPDEEPEATYKPQRLKVGEFVDTYYDVAGCTRFRKAVKIAEIRVHQSTSYGYRVRVIRTDENEYFDILTDEVDTKSALKKILEPDRQTVAVGKEVSIYGAPDVSDGFLFNIVITNVINERARHNAGYWVAIVGSAKGKTYYVLTDRKMYPRDVQELDTTEIELKTLEQNNEPVATPELVQEPTLLVGEFRIVQTASVGTPVYDNSEQFIVGYNDVIKRTWLVTPADYRSGFYEEFEDCELHRPCKTLYETKFFAELTKDK